MEQIKALINNPKTYILGLLFVFTGDKIWEYVQKGAESDIQTLIDNRIEAKVSDSQLVKTLLESDQVKEFTDEAGQSIRNKIIEDVTKSDSNKISLRSYLGKELGLRDEAVLPLLKDLMNDYKEGNIAKKEDINRSRRTPNIIEL